MNTKTLPTLLTTLGAAAAAACAGPGSPSPPGVLAYDVPSPPTVTYGFVDTTWADVAAPTGTVPITNTSAATMTLTFASAPEGVRVTGDVDSFAASSTNPMMGVQTLDDDDVEGAFDFVIGRRGDVEVTSLPEVAGPNAQLSPFAAIAHQLFPPLPDDVVEPGGTWVDTVTWTTTAETLETTSTGIVTYTLEGDTLVDGRSLLRFTLTGDVEAEAAVEQAGMRMTQTMAGSTTGFILWDMERGLPAYQEGRTEMEGSVTVPGMGTLSMDVSGANRVWLER